MKKYCVWMCALSLSLLAACGGGGGDSAQVVPKGNNVENSGNPNNTSNNAGAVSLSITAAKGAGMVGATVTVTDASGTAFTCPGTSDKDGKLSCTLPATFTAPFVIMAQLEDEKQYSVVPTASATTVNVTPLTTVVVAGLSSTGDPAQLAKDIQTDKSKASADAIKTQVDALNAQLRAVIDSTMGKDMQLDPLKGELKANTGTGQDGLLEAVKVSITMPDKDNAVAATQVISLKADPDAKVTISKDAPITTTITPQNVAAAKTIADSNPAVLVANLIGRMNACYALPVADRVAKTDGTGTATDVKADACKGLFVNNNASNFKNGGVGVSAKGAFKSLFSSLADGVVFDRGNLEYVVRNQGAANDGFWVVSYRSTDKGNNINYGNFVLKNEMGVLKQAGNQYDHDASVSSFVQDREFINDPSNSYLSTGYALTVTNKVDAAGASMYKQVSVTTPKGKVLYLKPLAGCGSLGLVLPDGKVNCTSFVRLNYGYKDASKTGDIPASERSILFFVPLASKYSDSELAAIPDQGTWAFEIEFADASKPKVTQMHRTLSRAPTLGELRKTVFADLTSKAKASVVADTKTSGAYVFASGQYAEISDTGGADFWAVPAGAAAPTNIRIYGRAPTLKDVRGNQFDDTTTVLASARSAQIKCSRLSAADLHCDAGVAVGASGFYAAGALATDLQLHAFLPNNSTRSKHFAFYYPNNNTPIAPATTKTLADFAGTYTITADWQAKGSDGKVADSGSTVGNIQISAGGAVNSCSVGDFIRCEGGFVLNTNKDGVTFSINASDGNTRSGTLSGTVNSSFVLSGSLSGTNTDGNYALSGTLTGRKQ